MKKTFSIVSIKVWIINSNILMAFFPHRVIQGVVPAGIIHTSSPMGGFVVRTGGSVIAAPSLPVQITYTSDSTKTVTVTGHGPNGMRRDFRVTRSATRKSRTSAQRAKHKADQAAYAAATKEANRQARAWEAYERQKEAARRQAASRSRSRHSGSRSRHSGSRSRSSTLVTVPSTSFGRNPNAWGIAPNGETIPVYGTGRPGGFVGFL